MSLLPYNNHNNIRWALGLKPVKRKVFISYHHKNDQSWYDVASEWFSDTLDLFYDSSVDRALDSSNAEYLNRKIREEYIFGTSVTIVLCGFETWKRRWVDWEIHATLHYEHGLLGIILPTCDQNNSHQYIVPARFHDNILSGYAQWIHWTHDAKVLKTSIEAAVQRSKSYKSSITNYAVKMKRSYS